MEAVIIYRSSWEARKSIPFFSAVDCNNSSPSQSTKTLRSDFLFSFSLIDPSRRCCLSPPSIYPFLVRLSVFTDIFSHHFTSFVIYFWSFHIIRDVFSPIFTSYFLVALPPLSIYNFTSNNHSFFSHLFQVWLYQLCKRDYSSYLDVLGLTITLRPAFPFQSKLDYASKSDWFSQTMNKLASLSRVHVARNHSNSHNLNNFRKDFAFLSASSAPLCQTIRPWRHRTVPSISLLADRIQYGFPLFHA